MSFARAIDSSTESYGIVFVDPLIHSKVSARQSNHRFATPNKSFDYVIENKSEDSSEVVKLTFDNYAVVPIIG